MDGAGATCKPKHNSDLALTAKCRCQVAVEGGRRLTQWLKMKHYLGSTADCLDLGRHVLEVP